jgi:hypothetical protein
VSKFVNKDADLLQGKVDGRDKKCYVPTEALENYVPFQGNFDTGVFPKRSVITDKLTLHIIEATA